MLLDIPEDLVLIVTAIIKAKRRKSDGGPEITADEAKLIRSRVDKLLDDVPVIGIDDVSRKPL